MFGIGTQELLIVFLIILLLFGASRIPEIAKAMGKGIRDFKKATQDVEEGIKAAGEDPDRIEDKSASGVESPGTSSGTKTGQKTS